MSITPKRMPVDELLGLGDARLIVPSYQRNYDWGKDEASDLWSDIETTEHGVYLGNVVFDVSKKGKGLITIVDGQQRLTTISLLLIACRSQALSIKANKLAFKISEKIIFTDSATGDVTGTRLEVSSSIRRVFEYIARDEWDGNFPIKIENKSVKRELKKIKPVFEYFKVQLATMKKVEDISAFLRKLYSSFVVTIEVEKDLDVFELFERANARGLELNAADLLKAHLFSTAESDNIEEKWNEIVSNGNSTILRMLKYYCVTKDGYIQKKDLFPKLKSYAKQLSADALIEDLSNFSDLYAIMRSGEEKDLRRYLDANNGIAISNNQHYCLDLYRNIEALRLFRVTQPFPILAGAIRAFCVGYGSNNAAAQMLKSLFEVIEKYHFVNNVICERVGNEIEMTYADFAPKFNDIERFATNCKELMQILKEKKAVSEEFVPKFKEIAYSTVDSLPMISYVFDRLNNYGRVAAQKTQIFFLDKKGFRRSYNVEHFFPQSKKGELADPDIIDNIGNLLVISLHTNSKLQDKPPLKKLEILKEKESFANLPNVKEFISDYESLVEENGWGAKEIVTRAEKLAVQAYRVVWSF